MKGVIFDTTLHRLTGLPIGMCSHDEFVMEEIHGLI